LGAKFQGDLNHSLNDTPDPAYMRAMPPYVKATRRFRS